jgi:hypothetical protein
MSDAALSSRASPLGTEAGSRLSSPGTEATTSGVSWAPVLAGAFVASAFSIALVTLGAGLGLISVSPWSNNNASATTFGVLSAAWLLAVQLFASGIGGYLAGRLRVRWVNLHTDEVYFRDTAHGLLVWAVGAVVSALLLTSAASSVVGGIARAGAGAVQAVATAAAGPGDQTAYFSDMLFRADHPATRDQAAAQAEVARIFVARPRFRRFAGRRPHLCRASRRRPNRSQPA